MTVQSKEERVFDVINYTIMSFIVLIVLYPLYYIVIASVSGPDAINSGRVWIWPVDFTLEGYKRIFNDSQILIGYRNVLIYTFFGTILNIMLTMMLAYALSRKKFFLKKALMIYITITMYFNGGNIPTYLIIKGLGLYNSWLVMIIMEAVNVFNVILARTFIQTSIPEELYEASVIDGCSHTKYFVKIVLPLSKTIIAILVLYYGIQHWNDYYNAMIYLSDANKQPLQLILRRILILNQSNENMIRDVVGEGQRRRIADLIKFGVIIVSSAPALILYPFLQRFFVRGIMIGSLKG